MSDAPRHHDERLRPRPGAGALLAAVPVIAGIAAWALRPLDAREFSSLAATTTPAPPTVDPGASLDLAGFDRPVFTVPARPADLASREPTPPPQPPPPPPLRLELLAIEHSEAGLRAVLYDPDENTVVTVAQGDTVAGRTVAAISAEGVRLARGGVEHALVLRADRPIGRGGNPR